VETALEVMAEHKDESKPSRTLVIDRTRARVIAGSAPMLLPSRAGPQRFGCWKTLSAGTRCSG
jgi:hypothetical protein